MISEFVFCDMCGIKIEKSKKHLWHNLNIVRHIRPIKVNDDRKMTASFHICTDDLKNVLFEVLGVNLTDDVHKATLEHKIGEKLRLHHANTYEVQDK